VEARGRKASVFFFEKRSKKLLSVLASVCGEVRQFEDEADVWGIEGSKESTGLLRKGASEGAAPSSQ
jgi:hypothetical protein